MKRKTIGLNIGIKQMLDEVMVEGESVNDALSRLLDDADECETRELDQTSSNVSISEETFNRLNDAKLFSGEAYVSVIFRLITREK